MAGPEEKKNELDINIQGNDTNEVKREASELPSEDTLNKLKEIQNRAERTIKLNEEHNAFLEATNLFKLEEEQRELTKAIQEFNSASNSLLDKTDISLDESFTAVEEVQSDDEDKNNIFINNNLIQENILLDEIDPEVKKLAGFIRDVGRSMRFNFNGFFQNNVQAHIANLAFASIVKLLNIIDPPASDIKLYLNYVYSLITSHNIVALRKLLMASHDLLGELNAKTQSFIKNNAPNYQNDKNGLERATKNERIGYFTSIFQWTSPEELKEGAEQADFCSLVQNWNQAFINLQPNGNLTETTPVPFQYQAFSYSKIANGIVYSGNTEESQPTLHIQRDLEGAIKCQLNSVIPLQEQIIETSTPPRQLKENEACFRSKVNLLETPPVRTLEILGNGPLAKEIRAINISAEQFQSGRENIITQPSPAQSDYAKTLATMMATFESILRTFIGAKMQEIQDTGKDLHSAHFFSSFILNKKNREAKKHIFQQISAEFDVQVNDLLRSVQPQFERAIALQCIDASNGQFKSDKSTLEALGNSQQELVANQIEKLANGMSTHLDQHYGYVILASESDNPDAIPQPTNDRKILALHRSPTLPKNPVIYAVALWPVLIGQALRKLFGYLPNKSVTQAVNEVLHPEVENNKPSKSLSAVDRVRERLANKSELEPKPTVVKLYSKNNSVRTLPTLFISSLLKSQGKNAKEKAEIQKIVVHHTKKLSMGG